MRNTKEVEQMLAAFELHERGKRAGWLTGTRCFRRAGSYMYGAQSCQGCNYVPITIIGIGHGNVAEVHFIGVGGTSRIHWDHRR